MPEVDMVHSRFGGGLCGGSSERGGVRNGVVRNTAGQSADFPGGEREQRRVNKKIRRGAEGDSWEEEDGRGE